MHILTKNITELDELIYAGMKLVFDKFDVPLKNKNTNSKPGCEIRLERQIRNHRQQAKIIRRYNGWNMYDEKKKQHK